MMDTYQPILQVDTPAPGGALLTVQRVGGGECPEWFLQYRNRFPWQPLGSNEMHLLPGWLAPRGASPRCRICVQAIARNLVPEVQYVAVSIISFDPDPAIEFRVRPRDTAEWSNWEPLALAALVARLVAVGAVAAVGGETFSSADSLYSWQLLIGIRVTGGRPSPLMQVQTRANPESMTMWTATRLQTGGGPTCDEFQLVAEAAGPAAGTLTFAGSESSLISPADNAAAAAATLADVIGPDAVAVPIKVSNLFLVHFQGDQGNRDVSPLVPSADLTVATIADGGPP